MDAYAMTAPDRLIPLAEVERQSGMKKTSIYDLIGQDLFPAPARIGAAARWSEREVQAWIALQLQKRNGGRNEGRREPEKAAA